MPCNYGHARTAAMHLRPDGTFALIEVDDADGGALAAFTAAAAVSRFLATGDRRLDEPVRCLAPESSTCRVIRQPYSHIAVSLSLP